MEYVLAAIGAVVVAIILKRSIKRVTVLEYERALRYDMGKFDRVLGPGQYWYLPFFTVIQKLNVRPRFVSIPGQEVLSSDGVTLKVSLAAKFEIIDTRMAVNEVQEFADALYLELQLALREIIGSQTIEAILSSRQEIAGRLFEATESKAAPLGLRLLDVNLKDIMFPGTLKEIFAQAVRARQEGLAALERARGETAALRNLANAAKMIDGNPNVLPLRLLQALSESTGNTLVLGMPPHVTPVPVSRDTAPKD